LPHLTPPYERFLCSGINIHNDFLAVQAGKAVLWFGQPGIDISNMISIYIFALLNSGILKVVN